jgi:pyruvate-formate lyase
VLGNEPVNDTPTTAAGVFGAVSSADETRRLTPETRTLAMRAISGEYGRAIHNVDFAVNPAEMEGLSPSAQYARAIALTAERAPLRITAGERVIGSATLLEGAHHATPACEFGSTSHTTIGFAVGLRIGYDGLRARIDERMARGALDDEGIDFLRSMLVCIDAAAVWHHRHVDLLEERIAESSGDERRTYEDVLRNLRRVPAEPAETFPEAMQSLWFLFAFQRLCGNWSGIGRIDEMLGPYLERDLADGTITLDDAREILAHFWIKGCEWIGAHEFNGTGDAQYYQNIVLGGVDADGNDVTNEVTYLVLDIVEELHISDFPIAVRIGRHTSERLLHRIAEIQKRGGGIVAVYNEDVVLRALERFGYKPEIARRFANDGCWEIIIPGETAFIYKPFDMLRCLQDAIGLGEDDSPIPDHVDFDVLYAAFVDRVRGQISDIHTEFDGSFTDRMPSPLLSLFVEDCIEAARGYHDRGARYTVTSPHASGMPDTINSLLVLKKLVFDERRVSLCEFVEILRGDWEGHESLRREVVHRWSLYGNGDPEADAMARQVFDDYVSIVGETPERGGTFRPAGISTFGRELAFREHRLATAFGRRKGDILASNLTPTPGTDLAGPTAVIRSYCGMDFERLPNGAPLDLKISPGAVRGQAGTDALVTLMRTFVDLGGMFLHVDVVDSETLRRAQEHPDEFPNLSVRVSGWCARFATLNRDWQDMIIQRTEHETC